MLKTIKDSLGIIIIVGGLLITFGSMLYRLNGLDNLVMDARAQGAQLAVIEQRTATLEHLRGEDLYLLREDIKELKAAIDRLDHKIDRLVK